MNYNFLIWVAVVAAVGCFAGCAPKEKQVDAQAHLKEIQQWQSARAERLKSEDGWLTLIGLFWLREGENTIGSDSSNAIILPSGKSIPVAGSIMLTKGALTLNAKKEAGITWKDSVVTTLTIQSDEEGNADPTILKLNSLMFYVIKRGEQYGVRLKDKESEARLNFKGMEYFPVSPKWRIEAKFEPYTPPKTIPIPTQIGTVVNEVSPGALLFEVDAKQYRLDAVKEAGVENELFIMFIDETSGKETYGNGRQLYTSLPDSSGIVILDFNKAYNWPCVFTPYATCPIPPKQNHLSLRVEAGEKMYAGH